MRLLSVQVWADRRVKTGELLINGDVRCHKSSALDKSTTTPLSTEVPSAKASSGLLRPNAILAVLPLIKSVLPIDHVGQPEPSFYVAGVDRGQKTPLRSRSVPLRPALLPSNLT